MSADLDVMSSSRIGEAAPFAAEMPRLIRKIRTRMGLTQEKFAARVGVTFPTINRWENGRAKPSPLALKQIQALLGELDPGPDLLVRSYETASQK
jgi:putative transcriptional regulator